MRSITTYERCCTATTASVWRPASSRGSRSSIREWCGSPRICRIRWKIRLSPTLCDVRHPFLRDKWILREVARRYVPRQISHRPKRAFPSHAFRRMEISDRFFHDSFVSQFFELSRGQVDYLNAHARRDLKLRLLQLECVGAGESLGGTQRADPLQTADARSSRAGPGLAARVSSGEAASLPVGREGVTQVGVVARRGRCPASPRSSLLAEWLEALR